ncbi:MULTISPECIES: holin [Pseudomonas]|uniref:holin n=1 Tax=Pseudomonas TaxID=286 RepID=UPI001C8053B2|nr:MULTISPECIES: holin [Pseudomonas]MDG9927395.1 holin [Pseudomonas sp. GD04042]MDH0482464.1 holin [Pseudomonas sp. GD04015]MDH0602816.1 holin [Pseudomonas sp. GD03869]
MAGKTEIAAEAALAATATKVTQGGAVAGLLGLLTQVNWIGAGGVLVALAGFLANLYFQSQRAKAERSEREAREAREQARERREQAEHEARMRVIHERCEL